MQFKRIRWSDTEGLRPSWLVNASEAHVDSLRELLHRNTGRSVKYGHKTMKYAVSAATGLFLSHRL